MKNSINLFLLILILTNTYSVKIFSMESPYNNVRVVPIAFDTNKNQWSVLLGLDRKLDSDGKNYWRDFYDRTRVAVKDEKTAQEILNNQTNKLYNINISGLVGQKVLSRITNNNDVVFFVPVDYKSGQDLFSKGLNAYKKDFVWIPANEFNQKNMVSRKHKEGRTEEMLPVSRGVKDLLANFLPEVTDQLTAIGMGSKVVDTGLSEKIKQEPKKDIYEEKADVIFTKEIKNKFMQFLRSEKRYIPYQFRELREDQKKQIIALLPAGTHELIRKKLIEKIRDISKEEPEIINQFIIESILNQMKRYNFLKTDEILNDIRKLNPCPIQEWRKFKREVQRYKGLTAEGKIVCNAGLCQWD